jgi:hypothetical protein
VTDGHLLFDHKAHDMAAADRKQPATASIARRYPTPHY